MSMNGCSKKLCPMQVGTVNNCTLTKEQCPYFTQEVDYQSVLNQIKAEVAREIFEEVEAIPRAKDFTKRSQDFEFGYRFAIKEILSELKKKYENEGADDDT